MKAGKGGKLLRFFRRLSAPQIIVLVFLAIVVCAAGLLCLPVSTRDGKGTDFLTALFTSTSASCVTGLTLGDTYSMWSGFGQAVLLVLIQIGGLGFMSIATVFFMALRAKIGLRSRLILSQSLGLDGMDGIVRLVRHVLYGTLLFEGAGALVLTLRFWMDVSFLKALRWGVFHAVSAFCNAGFDILGNGDSMAAYATDPTVMTCLMCLIVIGGLGFFVWEELYNWRKTRRLSVYTKLVLMISFFLIVAGTLCFAVLEWNNPASIGQLPVGKKLLASAFQSVTTRTAGFAALDQGGLTDASKAVCIVLMLIGGSSGSTAGGMKTVTVGVVLLTALAVARGRENVTVLKRTLPKKQLMNAFAIVFLMTVIVFFCAVYLSAACGLPFLDSLYETASALATVGLSTGLTPLLNTAGKCIIIVLMFFGRVGIMTISFGFLLDQKQKSRYKYAETKMMIG